MRIVGASALGLLLTACVGGAEPPPGRIARRIADYIAGMTDTYAVLAHRRLHASTPDLHWSPPSRSLPLTEP